MSNLSVLAAVVKVKNKPHKRKKYNFLKSQKIWFWGKKTIMLSTFSEKGTTN